MTPHSGPRKNHAHDGTCHDGFGSDCHRLPRSACIHTGDQLAPGPQAFGADDDDGPAGGDGFGAVGGTGGPAGHADSGNAPCPDRAGRLGGDPRPVSLLDQVCLRPAFGADGHSLVHAVRDDRRLRQPLHAPRCRLQPVLRPVHAVRAWHGRHVACGNHRDAVRRLGAGRAVLRAPGSLFSGTEGSRAERPVGLDHLPVLGRRPVAGRGGHAPPARRGRLRQVAGDGPLARESCRA